MGPESDSKAASIEGAHYVAPPQHLFFRTNLTAKTIAEATGLTYRQLNDWDSRKVLPHERKGEQGWRVFSPVDAIALRIAKDLRDKLGVPVEQMRPLLVWMQRGSTTTENNEPTMKGSADPDFTIGPYIIEVKSQKNPPAHLIAAQLHNLALALIESDQEQREQVYGVRGDIDKLLRTRWPLLSALGDMQTGLRMLLHTDLNEHCFLSEFDHAEIHRETYLKGGPVILFPLNEIVNEVLKAIGEPTFPIVYQLKDLEPSKEENIKAQERQLTALIRQREFKNILIEPVQGGTISLEVGIDLEVQREIIRIIKEHEYKAVTVKKCDGKIIRMTRKESVK